MTSRGINYWQSEDGKDRRLLFSINSFLQEIDARTGKSIPTFGVDGIVDLRSDLPRGEKMGWNNQQSRQDLEEPPDPRIGARARRSSRRPATSAPTTCVTGKMVWQFHTVPLPGEFGYDTWPKDAYKYVGGANNWGEMSIDDERGIVYIPTGSATYDFYGADRIGAEPVRQLPARARRAHRQAALALPDGASRPVGLRQRLGAAARDRPAQRPEASTPSRTPARPASSTCSIA